MPLFLIHVRFSKFLWPQPNLCKGHGMYIPAVCILKGVVLELQGAITPHPRVREMCGMAHLSSLFMNNMMPISIRGYIKAILGDSTISADQGNFFSPPRKQTYALRYTVYRDFATCKVEFFAHYHDLRQRHLCLDVRTVDTTCVEEQTHFSQALLHLRHSESRCHDCLMNSITLVPARLIISEPTLNSRRYRRGFFDL